MLDDKLSIPDYSLMIINQIDHNNDQSNKLSSIKALIYAGMIKYYGTDEENRIYLDFLKTKFVPLDTTIVDLLEEKYGLDSKRAAEISSHVPGTLLDTVVYRDEDGERIKRTIYFEKKLFENPSQLIEALTHQMNHIINSNSNSITRSKKDNSKLARMGISYDSYEKGRKIKSLPLEEAINKLQTKEIVHEIKHLDLSTMSNETMTEMMNSLLNSPSEETKKTHTEELAEEFYEIPILREKINKGRLSGHFKEFYDEVNSRLKYINYQIFLSSFDNLNSPDKEKASTSEDNIKQLIKTYKEN